MRSKKPLIVTLGLIALLAVFYYIYNWFYGPQRFQVGHPEKEQVILLKARPGKGIIYGIELNFQGQLSGEAIIYIGSGDEPFHARTRLKPGNVHARFYNEWMGDQVLLRYQPQEGATGNLTILYRFIRN